MPRLRTVSPHTPGWSRRRAGRGFSYLDLQQQRLVGVDLDRCKKLVIPPAWTEVWICPVENGHIQAVGTDVAGRRQYRYHDEWRRQRDADKHDRILKVARRLPHARDLVDEHLELPGLPREKALATAFRLLDLGFFRVGGESYAESNGSHGLATLTKDEVDLSGDRIEFTFTAKSGKEQEVTVADERVRAVIETMRRRRKGGDELLAWKDGRRWRDVTSDDVNAYVKEVIGGEVSAKDFRTWHATVLAAVALAVSTHAVEAPTTRKRAIARAMREVADYLGNTPAVARASYVDPRVVDLYEDGVTVERSLRRLGEDGAPGPATHGALERAVHRMLSRAPDAAGRAARR